MAVTKQVYPVTATWAVTTLANAFRDAFIDAGLMTDWYDSFLSGSVENRVLEVVYNGAKTWGKTYYWFMFTSTGARIAIATGWNTTTKVPTGTQWVDFLSNTTNSTSSHFNYLTLSNTTSVSLTRYTSGTRTFFILRSGTLFRTFTIDPPSTSFRSWYDLDLGVHGGIWSVEATTDGGVSYGLIIFNQDASLRRELSFGGLFRGVNTPTTYFTSCFNAYGMYSNAGNAARPRGVNLPMWSSNHNPSIVTDLNPVYTDLTIRPYILTTLPADFGISAIRNDNSLTIQDIATVSGSEAYEIISFTNGAGNTGHVTPAFLARTVGP